MAKDKWIAVIEIEKEKSKGISTANTHSLRGWIESWLLEDGKLLYLKKLKEE